MKPLYKTILLGLIATFFGGCKKLIQISPPSNTVVTNQVFSADAEATSAMSGIYSSMANGYLTFSNSGVTILCGLSADELSVLDLSQQDNAQFQQNALVSNNDHIQILWSQLYSAIYGANAMIEGLTGYSGVHDSVKNELTGEAEFIRAFCNFYLVNLFGDVPLITTANWRNTTLSLRTPASQVYEAIISDLTDAEIRLSTDYSVAGGQRIVPTKWAAQALLARVYLYMGNWPNAKAEADSVIANSGMYQLDSLNGVFLANSQESIWQLQPNDQNSPFNATEEGSLIIPFDNNTQPFVTLDSSLLISFETGDNRRLLWLDSTNYNNAEYYYPYKYKVGPAQGIPGAPVTEYYMVLRLAEQYLIRAEAEANGAGGGQQAAISDLDIIRARAGLSDYGGALIKDSVLAAILHERQIELFAEWGHRWFDLKRIGIATATLTTNKNLPVGGNALLYPIPIYDIKTDPNLTQNPGY
ncbi:MAG TPA: RagB/SusD family nutrient uptake outer membrane protein [Puia sp.]|nr:RagB/SusD family nutrient uptake outer membrane protein [Puia sp.]